MTQKAESEAKALSYSMLPLNTRLPRDSSNTDAIPYISLPVIYNKTLYIPLPFFRPLVYLMAASQVP